MKVAISSTGNSVDSKVDPRFGRCPFFCIYDVDTDSYTFEANNSMNSAHGAGPAAVQFVTCFNVGKIVSGDFGFKIKPILENLGIQMIVIKDDKTISDIITLLKNNK